MIEIRKVSADELPDCLGVIHKSFATVASEFGLTRENCPRHTSFIPIEYLQKQFESGWTMLGLYADGKLAGYMSLSADGGGYELHNLAVLPEYRHNGYGSRLLDYAKAFVKSEKLRIGIIEESTVLKSWYEANGFVSDGTKKYGFLPFTTGFMSYSKE